ncbi:hypothetical protein [Plesiomonas shigelloides]|nr:hypothetical protein [Plesiomonas shigelloides]
MSAVILGGDIQWTKSVASGVFFGSRAGDVLAMTKREADKLDTGRCGNR